MWRFLPYDHVLYALLCAHDGLALTSGPQYRRAMLALLLFLSVLGAPLAWSKTRGGQQVTRWSGLVTWWTWSTDFSASLPKRQNGFRGWIEDVLARKSVLGRDMRAALGRMGFLAGPLKHARPFFALVYRWTAKASPLAVQLTLMRFFLEPVLASLVRAPRAMPRPGGEIFRVDAKADAGMVDGNHFRVVPQVKLVGFL